MVRILDGTHPDGWEMPRAEIKDVHLREMTVRQMTEEERKKYGDPVPRTRKAMFKTIHDAVPEIDPVMDRQKEVYAAFKRIKGKRDFAVKDAADVMGVPLHYFAPSVWKREKKIVDTVVRFCGDEDKIAEAERRHAEREKGFKFGRK